VATVGPVRATQCDQDGGGAYRKGNTSGIKTANREEDERNTGRAIKMNRRIKDLPGQMLFRFAMEEDRCVDQPRGAGKNTSDRDERLERPTDAPAGVLRELFGNPTENHGEPTTIRERKESYAKNSKEKETIHLSRYHRGTGG
jgi:hypothetical protein